MLKLVAPNEMKKTKMDEEVRSSHAQIHMRGGERVQEKWTKHSALSQHVRLVYEICAPLRCVGLCNLPSVHLLRPMENEGNQMYFPVESS